MLLFDQNLSAALPRHLRDEFPQCSHVRDWAMTEAPDSEVLALAEREGYVVVTKDEDFASQPRPSSPGVKVIWVRLGNCTTADVVDLLRSHAGRIHAFSGDPAATLLELP